jgi:hypothetical protein
VGGVSVTKTVHYTGMTNEQAYTAYCDFQRQHRPGKPVRGLTTFTEARPRWCQRLKECHRGVCMCQYCVNMGYLAQALSTFRHLLLSWPAPAARCCCPPASGPCSPGGAAT